MRSNKTVQKKFRIDTNTDKAFQRILAAKKVSMQSVMESMLKEYICKNLEIVIENNKE